jgi:hypothetical protein
MPGFNAREYLLTFKWDGFRGEYGNEKESFCWWRARQKPLQLNITQSQTLGRLLSIFGREFYSASERISALGSLCILAITRGALPAQIAIGVQWPAPLTHLANGEV